MRLETESLDLMKGLAVRGLGMDFLNHFGIEREIQSQELVHIPLKPVIASLLGLYVRVTRTLPQALNTFVRVGAMKSLDGKPKKPDQGAAFFASHCSPNYAIHRSEHSLN